MKKFLLGAVGIAALFAVSCQKDKIANEPQKPLIPGASVDTIRGTISVNTTLTRETYLDGIVLVDSLVTLTVNPGVTIKGSPGGAVPDLVNLTNNKGTLVVRRGGKLIANGTANQPIVWTSSKPAGTRSFGDWGGVVILGKATTVTATNNSIGLYEAFRLAPNPVPFQYGAVTPDDNDNSGSLRYNRIEFAGGVVLEANREVNGLTVCGVGRGTTLEYIEVSNSGDDAYEFFGGRVNAKYLLAWNTKDDDYDFDEGYVGNLQFIIAYRGDLADNSGSEFVESDNNSAAAAFAGKTRTRATIANATFIGPNALTVRSGVTGTFDGGIYFRRESRLNLANSVVYCGALPTAIGITPTTRNDIDALPSATADRSYIRYNLFQTTAALPVIWDGDESNAIADGSYSAAPDNVLINELGGVTQQNTAYSSLAQMGINSSDLTLLPTGPARSNGVSLSFLDPFFTSTTQRGAVIDANKWTTVGSWLSIANN